ncbi:MAG: flagellar hook capping FlgD N-terminal domain-containing protein [Synergistales bacterium]|nr:flagellar hook capping FlgD N-terminal domain-containing protein [Synergistales bacterium]
MISPVSSASSGGSIEPTREIKKELGKDDFLQLLITQLTHQDPMDPLKNEAFIAQMAQFSSLEQMTNISKGIENLQQFQMIGAVGLIGKEVTAYDEAGLEQKATVKAVHFEEGKVVLETSEGYLLLEHVLSVSA